MKIRFTVLLVCVLLQMAGVLSVRAQPPLTLGSPAAEGPNRARLTGVVVGTAVFYGVTLYFLKKAWYKKKVPFHRFNDNREWLQMDKVGHVATAYLFSRGGYELFRWSGVNERASVLTGGLLALLFQSTIEVYDGYSEGWGFSRGDMLANVTGAALFMGQQYAFNEQKVTMRFGWRKSIYAPYRPNLLGKTTGVQFLKDYNAQQYWLSLNLASTLPVGPSFPKWLNLAVGYSGSGMIGGHENPPIFDRDGREVKFERYRQFFLSPDADLSRIGPLNDSWRRFIGVAQFQKIAAPSLEWNRVKGLRVHPLLVGKE
ncbi:DUF2279 domain-containing protein [Tellurirhabdus rosea]|uniref:DUF2279 domain-containing protein n=1 Tax=Tellurirhabdus rosea TaxID=2674997 RepID=UPI002256F846|nr:DUF2279 domain-containing protein [Tellurirhabdus rosea]